MFPSSPLSLFLPLSPEALEALSLEEVPCHSLDRTFSVSQYSFFPSYPFLAFSDRLDLALDASLPSNPPPTLFFVQSPPYRTLMRQIQL